MYIYRFVIAYFRFKAFLFDKNGGENMDEIELLNLFNKAIFMIFQTAQDVLIHCKFYVNLRFVYW